MSSRYLKRYATQWAGQFYVAAELTRRGYIATFTHGNAPVTDLLVRVPKGRAFSIEVKSATTKSMYQMKKPPVPDDSEDLFWIFVLLVEDPPKFFHQPKFFIVRSDTVLKLWHEWNDKFAVNTRPGIDQNQLEPYENQWDTLPGSDS